MDRRDIETNIAQALRGIEKARRHIDALERAGVIPAIVGEDAHKAWEALDSAFPRDRD